MFPICLFVCFLGDLIKTYQNQIKKKSSRTIRKMNANDHLLQQPMVVGWLVELVFAKIFVQSVSQRRHVATKKGDRCEQQTTHRLELYLTETPLSICPLEFIKLQNRIICFCFFLSSKKILMRISRTQTRKRTIYMVSICIIFISTRNKYYILLYVTLFEFQSHYFEL